MCACACVCNQYDICCYGIWQVFCVTREFNRSFVSVWQCVPREFDRWYCLPLSTLCVSLFFIFIHIFIADNVSIWMYIKCVILCVFSALSHRVGSLQISRLIIYTLCVFPGKAHIWSAICRRGGWPAETECRPPTRAVPRVSRPGQQPAPGEERQRSVSPQTWVFTRTIVF